jgi:hypothetical protein
VLDYVKADPIRFPAVRCVFCNTLTREADSIHDELTQAELGVERLEARLVLRGIANEDQTTSALAYLERFARFLAQLLPDQLRRTFDALGVWSDIPFEPNKEPGPGVSASPSVPSCPSAPRWLGGRPEPETTHPRRVPRVGRQVMRLGLVAGEGFEPPTFGL